MKKVITYGTYDLLHEGHLNLLRRAKALGDYLIVGVTNDSFDRERGKLNVRNNVLERVEAVKATGIVDQVIIEDYMGQKSMTSSNTMSTSSLLARTGRVSSTTSRSSVRWSTCLALRVYPQLCCAQRARW